MGAAEKWKLARLNNLNTEIDSAGWIIKDADASTTKRLIISGPLGPGEMILLESVKKTGLTK